MPRPVRIDGPGAVHHVVARGNERKPIFRDDEDRSRLLDRFARSQPRLGFQLLAFCLMDNHIHLVMRTGTQPLSRVMLTLLSSYAVAFNRRHGRVGHLFQGRYKASLIKDDRHLLAVVRYVHRNPVAARITERASLYAWSSDRIYRVGGAPAWIDTTTVLGLLDPGTESSRRAYCSLVDGDSDQDDDPEILETDTDQVIDLPEAPLPCLEGREVEYFVRSVAEKASLTVERLRSSARARSISRTRAIVALLARDLARIPISRTAESLNRDESTLSRGVVRLEGELTSDSRLRQLVDQLREDLVNNAFLHG
jgi:REP element-mobilizing transposase RayT